jgi:hypothetical protein
MPQRRGDRSYLASKLAPLRVRGILESWYPAVSLRSTAGYRLKSLRDGNQKQGQTPPIHPPTRRTYPRSPTYARHGHREGQFLKVSGARSLISLLDADAPRDG